MVCGAMEFRFYCRHWSISIKEIKRWLESDVIMPSIRLNRAGTAIMERADVRNFDDNGYRKVVVGEIVVMEKMPSGIWENVSII